MATSNRLKLTRDQLAAFLQDHEQIKQFEALFGAVDVISNETLVELAIDTGIANASANEALAQIADTNAIVDLTASNPAIDNGNKPALDYVDFNLTVPHIDKTGRMVWNTTDQTLDLGMDYGITQQIGQETYARVGNTTGSTIPSGTVVGFAGATTNALLVSPYLANGSTPTLYILGIMAHALPDSGEKGYCTTWGFVRNINTSAFNPGDILYASPSVAGGLTKIKPTAPNNVIPIAACVTSNATTGVIFVRPTIEQQKYYGEFTKTTDAAPSSTNTAYTLVFDNTEVANGISLGSPASRVVVTSSGLYQFNATVQITSASSSPKTVWIWFRKNGADIANTARLVTTDINSGYIPISMSEFFSLAANDYVEVAFAADDTNITIDTVAATAFAPAAPSVVLSVTQVQQ